MIGYFEFRKGVIIRSPMLNPYTQDTLEATIRMNHGLLKYINGDVEEATDQIEESLAILQRWKKED